MNIVHLFLWAVAERLISSTVPTILAFVHIRKPIAYDAVLLCELRNQNAAKWGSKVAVSNTRAVVCKPLGLS